MDDAVDADDVEDVGVDVVGDVDTDGDVGLRVTAVLFG